MTKIGTLCPNNIHLRKSKMYLIPWLSPINNPL
uniref:Uncharacterized protein n=2 Tax=unclassified Caudoviricetes TaxID=2788787 RepID=A0A8S5Q8Q7_9CAUD|nr:MAG TPA: hypothetical protein [Siphoviridae sp. ctAvK3]DAE15193.1 MAG TPA: hypothetical protein [Siphoviridae sp. ctdVv30]